jgi:hypothetical protein
VEAALTASAEELKNEKSAKAKRILIRDGQKESNKSQDSDSDAVSISIVV